jgi:hypothetical protein
MSPRRQRFQKKIRSVSVCLYVGMHVSIGAQVQETLYIYLRAHVQQKKQMHTHVRNVQKT